MAISVIGSLKIIIEKLWLKSLFNFSKIVIEITIFHFSKIVFEITIFQMIILSDPIRDWTQFFKWLFWATQ